jgi:hypothetical protein
MSDGIKYKHLFQHGSCVFCGKPIDFMPGVQSWRGGHILPPSDEECLPYKKWHKKAEENAIKEAEHE